MLRMPPCARRNLRSWSTGIAHHLSRQIASLEPHDQRVTRVVLELLGCSELTRALTFALVLPLLKLRLRFRELPSDLGLSPTSRPKDFCRRCGRVITLIVVHDDAAATSNDRLRAKG